MTSRRGVRLAGLLHLPAGAPRSPAAPAVVLCHGMESTKEGTKHQALAARLTALGYVCLRFDFSYVGESGGAFEDLTISGEVEDLGGAVDFLTRARGRRPSGSSARASAARSPCSSPATMPRVRALVTIAAVALPARDRRAHGSGRGRRRGAAAGSARGRRAARGAPFSTISSGVDVAGGGAPSRRRRPSSPTATTIRSCRSPTPTRSSRRCPSRRRWRSRPACDHRYSDPAHLDALSIAPSTG